MRPAVWNAPQEPSGIRGEIVQVRGGEGGKGKIYLKSNLNNNLEKKENSFSKPRPPPSQEKTKKLRITLLILIASPRPGVRGKTGDSRSPEAILTGESPVNASILRAAE